MDLLESFPFIGLSAASWRNLSYFCVCITAVITVDQAQTGLL